MNRRQFIQTTGIALTAAGCASVAGFASSKSLNENIKISSVIVDNGSSVAAKFGQNMSKLGFDVKKIGLHSAHLPFDNLVLNQCKSGSVFAGLTTMETFTCFEQIARDKWMKPVYVGVHYPNSNNMMHRLEGHQDVINRFERNMKNESWTDSLLLSLTNMPSLARQSNKELQSQRLSEDTEMLVSWVIAPIHNV